MKYVISTTERGWKLQPNRTWDGKDKDVEFIIKEQTDSNYAKYTDSRRSGIGYATFIEEAPVSVKSSMQNIMDLSVTEAETIAALYCIHDILYN